MSAVNVNGRLDLVAYHPPVNEGVLNQTDDKLTDEQYVILIEAAKALGVKEDAMSYFPARQKLHLSYALIGGAITGGAAGGAIGILGGPKGICIGIGVGMIVGAVGAVIVYKKINPGNYEKWRDAQTKETMIEFAKVFQGEQFKPFVCQGTKKIMMRPAIGTCGHKFDFEYYHKKVKDTMHYDRGLDKEVGFCPISNDNTCMLTTDEIRVDYHTMVKLIGVYKEFISQKAPDESRLSPKLIQGLKQLHDDLGVLMKHCYKEERNHNIKLADEGIISEDLSAARNFQLARICSSVLSSKV